jgi:hypothetical protein
MGGSGSGVMDGTMAGVVAGVMVTFSSDTSRIVVATITSSG